MFAKSYFSQPELHNILHHFFDCVFYHFNCLHILEGGIISITEYNYHKHSSIAAWGKSGGSFDEKVKVKYQKKMKGNKFLIVNYK